ncbi:MAG: hypothetical protein QXT53_07625 [Ignisphaera sp.]
MDHYLFAASIDKNSGYRIVKEFASMQVGAARDIESNAAFESAYQYLVPLYLYEINVKAMCVGESEKVEEDKVEMDVHGGEEFAYIVTHASNSLPIAIPNDYSFPARSRTYFKPSIIKEGIYLNPTLDPEVIFNKVKEPYTEKAASEARTACGSSYRLVDNSRYVGIAHYPFWLVKYRYRDRVYTSIVDAADDTVVYLEYPIDPVSRLKGLAGGVAAMAVAAIVGGLITMTLANSTIYGVIGGALASAPALAVALQKLLRSRAVYRYKLSEEAVFAPVR